MLLFREIFIFCKYCFRTIFAELDQVWRLSPSLRCGLPLMIQNTHSIVRMSFNSKGHRYSVSLSVLIVRWDKAMRFVYSILIDRSGSLGTAVFVLNALLNVIFTPSSLLSSSSIGVSYCSIILFVLSSYFSNTRSKLGIPFSLKIETKGFSANILLINASVNTEWCICLRILFRNSQTRLWFEFHL